MRKRKYRCIETHIIDFFFTDCSIDKLKTGTRLNGHSPNPFIKKRLGGSGGFRMYYYLLIKDSRVYLSFVHPKTGKMGADNIDPKSIAHLISETALAIESQELFKVQLCEKRENLEFLPLKQVEEVKKNKD